MKNFRNIYLFDRKNLTLNKLVSSSLWDLPSPSSMSYFWNFGSLLGLILVVQILSGLFLSMHYISFSDFRFSRVIHINRDVIGGWLVRFIHINGASFFFIFIYLHIARGIFFSRFSHKKVWFRGSLILVFLIAISFLGYVLPWGQMSYWAVAVITNLFSIFPLIGTELVYWIWGGFSVRSPTLTRFYSLHFLFPFVLAFIVLVHLYFLHNEGSSSNLGINRNLDKIRFHPFFSLKDFFRWVFLFRFSMLIILFFPYIFGDPVNFVPADPLSTPIHIQPEWYFLFYYAILRSFPRKLVGILVLASSVAILFILPYFNYEFSSKFRNFRYFFYWIFCFNFVFLSYLGAIPAEGVYLIFSYIFSIFHFFIFFLINI